MKLEPLELEVLKHIVSNNPQYIEELAEQNKLDESASVGIARAIIGYDGDISKLKPNQNHHYEKCIKPLLEDVPCDGVFGPDTCTGTGYVDDDSLLISYMSGDFMCQHCRFDADRIDSE
jgi:hypothetical protein